MLRNDLRWHFPEKLEEALSLLSGKEIKPHAGGTAILRVKPSTIRALIDLSKLNLKSIEEKDDEIHLGAMLTFSDIIASKNMEPSLEMLTSALSKAASTPLRNRITLGGSIADSPPWSDLTAPLLCLNVSPVIVEKDGSGKGINSTRMNIEQYLKSKNRLGLHLIKEIIVKKQDNLVFAAERLGIVSFDYSPLHLAIAGNLEAGQFINPRIYVTGTTGRYSRLKEVEDFIVHKKIESRLAERAAEQVNLKFPPDYRFSSNYKLHMAKTILKDAFIKLWEEYL